MDQGNNVFDNMPSMKENLTNYIPDMENFEKWKFSFIIL
jgi:hypothetical protein